MRKIVAAVLAGLISASLGWCEDSSGNQKTVAVCEFEVTGTKDVDADWIKQGVPDLLQIELQDQGISLLDRDFVASVLREQRREASGVMDGRNRVGGLLGARILVEGEARIEGKRIRLSTTAATVPENEVVATSSAEGEYPQAVNKLIEKLGKELGAKLAQYTHSEPPARTADRYIPSPEVMILFHRALDLYGRGFPAASAAWFNFVTRADPLFESAKIWEVKAYDQAGFKGHARVSAEKYEIDEARLQVARGEGSKPLRTVRVMIPQVSADMRDCGFLPQVIRDNLEAMILKDEEYKLFDGETLEAVVAEQDLHLGDGFARRAMPRYDQWLVVDAILTSRLTASDNADQARLHVRLQDPMSGTELGVADVICASNDFSSLGGQVRELLHRDRVQTQQSTPIALNGNSIPKQQIAGVNNSGEKFAELAKLLNSKFCGNFTSMELSDMYRSMGEDAHAVMEMETALRDAIDSDMDAEDLYSILVWVCKRKNMLEMIDDCKELTQALCDRIIQKDQDGVVAARILYGRARRAFDRSKWKEASTEFYVAIETLERAYANSRSNSARQQFKKMLHASHYMLARSQYEQGLRPALGYFDNVDDWQLCTITRAPTRAFRDPIWPWDEHRDKYSKVLELLVGELRNDVLEMEETKPSIEWIYAGKEEELIHLLDLAFRGDGGKLGKWNAIEDAKKQFLPIFTQVISRWENSPPVTQLSPLPGYKFVKRVILKFGPDSIMDWDNYVDRAIQGYFHARGLECGNPRPEGVSISQFNHFCNEAYEIFKLEKRVLRDEFLQMFANKADKPEETDLYESLEKGEFSIMAWDNGLQQKFQRYLKPNSVIPVGIVRRLIDNLNLYARHEESAKWYRKLVATGEANAKDYKGFGNCLYKLARYEEIMELAASVEDAKLSMQICEGVIGKLKLHHVFRDDLFYSRKEIEELRQKLETECSIALPFLYEVYEYKLRTNAERMGEARLICRSLHALKRDAELEEFIQKVEVGLNSNAKRKWAGILALVERDAAAAKLYDKLYETAPEPKDDDETLNLIYHAGVCYLDCNRKEAAADRFREFLLATTPKDNSYWYSSKLLVDTIRSGKPLWRTWTLKYFRSPRYKIQARIHGVTQREGYNKVRLVLKDQPPRFLECRMDQLSESDREYIRSLDPLTAAKP